MCDSKQWEIWCDVRVIILSARRDEYTHDKMLCTYSYDVLTVQFTYRFNVLTFLFCSLGGWLASLQSDGNPILWHFAPRLNHLAARLFPIVLGLWRRIIIHDDTLTRVLYDAERHLYLLIFDKLHFLALIRMWDTWGNCDVDLVLSLLQSSSVNIWRREKKVYRMMHSADLTDNTDVGYNILLVTVMWDLRMWWIIMRK